ncbi:uncharacterized protein LOC111614298 [Centruroides sculpturatus]|uniref:uncharacterized protein LOC111614298 n=1 Tax=Centruroides sculpturatus TaxID=218467 RepID=UPI000C6EC328|nr:uncharacterized protein LOC111614298 [Centruroides sculpturatus]
MDDDNRIKCSSSDLKDINADDFDKNLNVIPIDEPEMETRITEIKCEKTTDDLEESKLSSDSDDIKGFYFCSSEDQITPFKRKRRPLKTAFVYLETYSLAKGTIKEEEELGHESSEDDVSSTNSDTDVTSKYSLERLQPTFSS